MPYIKEERRDTAYFDVPETSGELTYRITMAVLDYLGTKLPEPITYDDFNTVIGSLECAKMEFYRRMMVQYEDKKIKENGDVYPEWRE